MSRVRGAFFSHVLAITQGNEHDVYAVEEATEGFTHTYRDELGREREGCYYPPSTVAPRSFFVCKCPVTTGEWLYVVTLGARPSCTCYGFNRWQNCKHIDALADLVKRSGI